MPRNSGGTYTLPNTGFTPNTVISSASVNQNFSDIATALTLSMATDGSSTPSGPIKFAQGTAAAPSIIFLTGGTAAGLFAYSANVLGISNSGVQTVRFNANNSVDFFGSVTAALDINFTNSADPTSPAANNLKLYVKDDPFGNSKLYTKDENGLVSLVSTGTFGQCRLIVNGGNLQLVPYGGGNLLTINNQNYAVSSPTLARVGVADNTFFYIYAYMNAGVMTLEASTTGHTQQSNGIETKTGDATRSLVGAAYSSTGSFKDTAGNLLTLSWYNRRRKVSYISPLATTVAISAGTYTEFTGITRTNYISWQEESIEITSQIGIVTPSGTNGSITVGININSPTTAFSTVIYNNYTNGVAGANPSITLPCEYGTSSNITSETVLNYATLAGVGTASSVQSGPTKLKVSIFG